MDLMQSIGKINVTSKMVYYQSMLMLRVSIEFFQKTR